MPIAAAAPSRPRTTVAWEWQATGTRWRIHHSGRTDVEAAAAVARAVESDEARWSRFREDSEVARVSRGAGSPVTVSDETFELLEACARWHEQTDGAFQPLVGRALEAWGYGSSLGERRPFAERSPRCGPLTGALELDPLLRTVRFPEGTSLDLGGIAKAWIAGRAAALLCRVSADPLLLVDAGGDLVAARGGHLVAVERPGDEPGGVTASIHLHEGACVATSGSGRRRWRNGDGVEAHHLIDPATGAPARPAHATVVAGDAAAADVLAKTLALRPETLAAVAEPALVTVDGEERANAAWRAVLVP